MFKKVQLMENVLELLKQGKEYEAYLLVKSKAVENVTILENLFDLDVTVEYSDDDNRFIDFLRSLKDTPYDWMFYFLRDHYKDEM